MLDLERCVYRNCAVLVELFAGFDAGSVEDGEVACVGLDRVLFRGYEEGGIYLEMRCEWRGGETGRRRGR